MNIEDKAPDFELKDTNFLGKVVVLYFYPKDETPGCTKEACSIRDNFSKIISMNDEKSHKKFTEKYNLPFDLLCDTKGEVAKTYGVKRTTFIIDKMVSK